MMANHITPASRPRCDVRFARWPTLSQTIGWQIPERTARLREGIAFSHAQVFECLIVQLEQHVALFSHHERVLEREERT
jgi:hypothetical protein